MINNPFIESNRKYNYNYTFFEKSIEFEYLKDYPYINVFNYGGLDDYRVKLLSLAHIENRFLIKVKENNEILNFKDPDYDLNQMVTYILSGLSINTLYTFCMQNSLPLIPCCLISKSILISEQSILAFNSCNFFNEFYKIFYLQDHKIRSWYLTFLNKYKKIIYKYYSVFPIKIFSPIIKYPDIIIDKMFKEFDFKENMYNISVQKPSFDVLINHIEELPDNLSCFDYLESDNFETLRLMKEMLN